MKKIKLKKLSGEAAARFDMDEAFGPIEDREMVRRQVARVLGTYVKSGLLNPAKIIRDMGCLLCTYSQLESICGSQKADFMRTCYPFGFSYYDYGLNKPCVYYEDKLEYPQVIATLFHEMGHVALRHIYKDQTGVCEEKQAELFFICIGGVLINLVMDEDISPFVADDNAPAAMVVMQSAFMEKNKTGKYELSDGAKEILVAVTKSLVDLEREYVQGCRA